MPKFIIGKDETFEGVITDVQIGSSQYGQRYEIHLKDDKGVEKVLMCPKRDVVSSRSMLSVFCLGLNTNPYATEPDVKEWIGARIKVKGDGTRRNVTIVSMPTKLFKKSKSIDIEV